MSETSKVDWAKLKYIKYEDAISYLNSIGYTINGKKIEAYYGWEDGEDRVFLEDGVKIAWIERYNELELEEGDNYKKQSANSSWDMERFIERGDSPIFKTLSDAKRFVNFLKNIGSAKIPLKYKFLVTGETEMYQPTQIDKESLAKIFKKEKLIFVDKDYEMKDDGHFRTVYTDVYYTLERVHTHDVGNVLIITSLTYKKDDASIWDSRIHIEIKQEFLPTGKLGKAIVKVYKQIPMSDNKHDIILRGQDGIHSVIQQLKNLHKPTKKEWGGIINGKTTYFNGNLNALNW